MNLKKEQMERYKRHILLKNIGVEGQKKIIEGKVIIIGAGGLGSPVSLYLSAAGVGTIGIVDPDSVDLSNLQRQVIHFTEDINIAKIKSAALKMKAINPEVKIKTYHEYVKADNIIEIIRGYDFVVDCTDNFSTKFLINDACISEKIPYSHGGILEYKGQAMTIIPGKTACYRCVFDKPPSITIPASQFGVLGAIAGILGSIQATEALKFLLKEGQLLTDILLSFDALNMNFKKIKFRKRKNCAVCGENPSVIFTD